MKKYLFVLMVFVVSNSVAFDKESFMGTYSITDTSLKESNIENIALFSAMAGLKNIVVKNITISPNLRFRVLNNDCQIINKEQAYCQGDGVVNGYYTRIELNQQDGVLKIDDGHGFTLEYKKR